MINTQIPEILIAGLLLLGFLLFLTHGVKTWLKRRRASTQKPENAPPSKPRPQTPTSSPPFDLPAIQAKVIQRIEDTGIKNRCLALTESPTTPAHTAKFFVLGYMDQIDRNTRLNWSHATDAFHIKGLLGVTTHDEKSFHDREAIIIKKTERMLGGNEGGRMGLKLNANILMLTLLGLAVFAYFYTNPVATRVLTEAAQKYMLHIIVSATLIIGLALYLVLRRRRVER